MFTTPGAITGKKEDTVRCLFFFSSRVRGLADQRPITHRPSRFVIVQPFEDPNATFIRGITYRSTDSFRFAELHKEISDLKKTATKRENERKELADVVEQDKLIEIKGA